MWFSMHAAFWASLIVVACAPTSALKSSVSPCCTALSLVLPKKVFYPASTSYDSSSSSYWSKQEESLSPKCIVAPTTVHEVATTVKTLTLLNKAGVLGCRFAIRGGGHTPWAGSANIDGGVTIDMRGIHDVTVNGDKSVASVGAGALWGDVYREMDALNLTVVGGRGSSIGVGGLLTGGGISYFSARYGFACDNVVNYQVVLANGKTVSANATSNPDLFRALKGGGNNFGIVTRFDLAAFPQDDFWGGMILYADSASPDLLAAFSNLNKAVGFDEYAALILSLSYVQPSDLFVASANIEYTKKEVNPETFRPFTKLQPQLQNSMRISKQEDFTTEFIQFQGNGRRQLYLTNTFKNDLTFLNSVYDMYKKAAHALSNITNSGLSLTIQPIAPAITSRSAARGGNSLGLDPEDGALVLCLISLTWDFPSADTHLTTLAKTLNNDIISSAKTAGLHNEWVYLNYADGSQDPISGYGLESEKRLREVSRKYDPSGVWQRSVPGGFKLFV